MVHPPVLLRNRVHRLTPRPALAAGLAPARADAVRGVRDHAVEDLFEAGAEGRQMEVASDDADGAREPGGARRGEIKSEGCIEAGDHGSSGGSGGSGGSDAQRGGSALVVSEVGPHVDGLASLFARLACAHTQTAEYGTV